MVNQRTLDYMCTNDGNKKWIISVIYARSSTTRSLITNVHQGAKVAVLDDYLKETQSTSSRRNEEKT